MKNMKFVVILTVLLLLSCLLLSGCKDGAQSQSTPPSNPGSEGKPDDNENNESVDPASCVHSETYQRSIKSPSGFEEGEAHIICKMCATTLDQVVLPRVESRGLAYKVNDDGTTCTVTGIGSCTDEDICIPEKINGYTVVEIAIDAFHFDSPKTDIKRLYIPSTVKKVGARAFARQKKLEKVYISDGVTNLGFGAFEFCDSLTDVRLPADLTVIRSGLFEYCTSLKNIAIPDGVTVIDQNAFSDCRALLNIEFPEGLTIIGYGAFSNTGILSVEAPDGLEYVGAYAFEKCKWLKKVKLPDSVKYLGGHAFSECVTLTDVTLSKGLARIEGGTFYKCSMMKSISIPEGVMYIGDRAFEKCSALKELKLPSTIMDVGEELIKECDALELNQYENGLYLGNDEHPYTVLIDVSDTSVASLSVHEDTRAMMMSALSGCTDLKNISIPDGLIGVGVNMFGECEQLEYNLYKNGSYLGNSENPYALLVKFDDRSVTEAEIHPSTKVLGDRSLAVYYRLSQVVLPEGLVSINAYAFQGQSQLVSVELPSGIKYLGEHTFADCDKLKSLVIPGSVQCMGDDVFSHCDKLASVEFLDGITVFSDLFYHTAVKTVILPSSLELVLSLPYEGQGAGKRLETVIYNGSIAEWNETVLCTLGDNVNLKIKIVCTDGEILMGKGWEIQE